MSEFNSGDMADPRIAAMTEILYQYDLEFCSSEQIEKIIRSMLAAADAVDPLRVAKP